MSSKQSNRGANRATYSLAFFFRSTPLIYASQFFEGPGFWVRPDWGSAETGEQVY